VPEGDTIHRIAERLNDALAGCELTIADAPSPRSPPHGRVERLHGRRLECAEARGKHLLIHVSGGLAVHSHLGMNGRWSIDSEGRPPARGSWLSLGAATATASKRGARLLRLVNEARLTRDPSLAQLGPDPLADGFDATAAAQRLRELDAGRPAAEALLDQRLIAGIGNAIANEACFAAAISPWRQVAGLTVAEAERLVAEAERIMRVSTATGRRPRRIYRATRSGCPACGGRVESRGQGDANRTTYWCPRCQS
jgi:endonuclease-8